MKVLHFERIVYNKSWNLKELCGGWLEQDRGDTYKGA
jgi:hypothetical protein